MKRILKKIAWIAGIMAILIALMLVCNQIVVNNAKGKAFSHIDSIKYNKVGLLLGTTPQARIGRILQSIRFPTSYHNKAIMAEG